MEEHCLNRFKFCAKNTSEKGQQNGILLFSFKMALFKEETI